MARDLYRALGVPRNASSDAIKSAFRKLAVKYHPDKNPGKASEVRFKEIAHAYGVLHDEQRRKHYNEFGEDNVTESPAAKPSKPKAAPTERSNVPLDGGPDNLLGDMFADFVKLNSRPSTTESYRKKINQRR